MSGVCCRQMYRTSSPLPAKDPWPHGNPFRLDRSLPYPSASRCPGLLISVSVLAQVLPSTIFTHQPTKQITYLASYALQSTIASTYQMIQGGIIAAAIIATFLLLVAVMIFIQIPKRKWQRQKMASSSTTTTTASSSKKMSPGPPPPPLEVLEV